MESTKHHGLTFGTVSRSLLYGAVLDATKQSTTNRRWRARPICDADDEPSLIRYMERIGGRLCVEPDLIAARMPIANGGELRAVVEPVPGGDWDWIVWRVGCPPSGYQHACAHNRWLALSAACLVVCQWGSAIPA